MVPIQKISKDDERDDSFRRSRSDTQKYIASNERLSFIGALKHQHGVTRSSIPDSSGTWNKSVNRSSVGDDNTYRWHIRHDRPIGMVPVSYKDLDRPRSVSSIRPFLTPERIARRRLKGRESSRVFPGNHQSSQTSRVIIPRNQTFPKTMVLSSQVDKNFIKVIPKKRSIESEALLPTIAKRSKTHSEALEGKFHKLDLLCSATLELGPLQDNPTGCSCPKSKCIALYCDCFKAGRRCSANCACLNCKNTVRESGANGARSKAIQTILARNPRAFINAGSNTAPKVPPPGEQFCNCIRSRCLKLYCACFQSGRPCNPSFCTCISCLNDEKDRSGARKTAIRMTLEKRPDAFHQKRRSKEIGSGCGCKNNKCLKLYCECLRTKLYCSNLCSCKDCENKMKA